MLGAGVTTALHTPSSFSSTSVAWSRSESSFTVFTGNKPSLPAPLLLGVSLPQECGEEGTRVPHEERQRALARVWGASTHPRSPPLLVAPPAVNSPILHVDACVSNSSLALASDTETDTDTETETETGTDREREMEGEKPERERGRERKRERERGGESEGERAKGRESEREREKKGGGGGGEGEGGGGGHSPRLSMSMFIIRW